MVSLRRILPQLRHLDRLVDLDRPPIPPVVPLGPVEVQVVVYSARNLHRQGLEVGHLGLEQADSQAIQDLEVIRIPMLKVDLELVYISFLSLTDDCS